MAFRKGDVVTVFNQRLDGEPVIEGRATILRPTGIEDQYMVVFGDSRTSFARFVFADGQENPEGFLEEIRGAWRAFERPRFQPGDLVSGLPVD